MPKRMSWVSYRFWRLTIQFQRRSWCRGCPRSCLWAQNPRLLRLPQAPRSELTHAKHRFLVPIQVCIQRPSLVSPGRFRRKPMLTLRPNPWMESQRRSRGRWYIRRLRCLGPRKKAATCRCQCRADSAPSLPQLKLKLQQSFTLPMSARPNRPIWRSGQKLTLPMSNPENRKSHFPGELALPALLQRRARRQRCNRLSLCRFRLRSAIRGNIWWRRDRERRGSTSDPAIPWSVRRRLRSRLIAGTRQPFGRQQFGQMPNTSAPKQGLSKWVRRPSILSLRRSAPRRKLRRGPGCLPLPWTPHLFCSPSGMRRGWTVRPCSERPRARFRRQFRPRSATGRTGSNCVSIRLNLGGWFLK